MSTTTLQIKQLRAATLASVLDCVQALEAQHGDFDKALEQLRAIGLTKAEQQADRVTHDGLVVVKRSGSSVCAIKLNCETDFVALTQEFKALAHGIADRVLADAALTEAEPTLAASFSAAPGHSIDLAIKELAGKLGENITLGGVARYEATGPGVVEGYVHAGAIEGYGPLEGRLGVLVELAADEAIDLQVVQELAHNLALQIASGSPTYVARDDIPAAEMDRQRQAVTAQAGAANKPAAIQAKIVEGRLSKFYQEVCLLSQPYIKDDGVTVGELVQHTSAALGAPLRVVRFARFELEL